MKAQVVLDERGDEVVIVAVTLVPAQPQRLAGRGAGLLEKLGQQLSLRQEFVCEALIDQDFPRDLRTACCEKLHRVVAGPRGGVRSQVPRERLLSPGAA